MKLSMIKKYFLIRYNKAKSRRRKLIIISLSQLLKGISKGMNIIYLKNKYVKIKLYVKQNINLKLNSIMKIIKLIRMRK